MLGTRLRRVEDTPHPSANAVAAILLIKLFHLTGKDAYRDLAERTLRLFGPSAAAAGVHAGTYACALDAWFKTVE